MHSEVEEEAGSAEEQPASNRLLHYTETVLARSSQMAVPFVSGSATWLRKPIQVALQHDSPTDYANSVFVRQSVYVLLQVFASRYSYEAAQYCRT